ncbi:MAG: hypothetical protein QMD94_02175 [Candidatus Omnitrophota bacterium]|nr:hypothetical protein [Candidatus Omnitrophota bacterium]
MHEAHLLEKMFRYFEKEEELSSRRLKKAYISISGLGSISEGHFREHFKAASANTKWESLKIEIKNIPYGPELEITKLDFV